MSDKIVYPWYEEIDANRPLEQGDIVCDCQIIHPVIKAEEANQTIEAEFVEYDVVVMSQSCDLIANKIELALVSPFYPLTELGDMHPEYKTVDKKNKLRQGHVFGMHLLNECDVKDKTDFLVVDFKSVYAVPLPFLRQIVSSRAVNRKRLLPPYREHLSQAFARFFMRVGLPVDIPEFK